MKLSWHRHGVRLNVEVLEGRELPSSLLSSGIPTSRFSSSQAQTVQAREAARRSQCRNNLKQLGLVGNATNLIRVPTSVPSTTWGYSSGSSSIIGVLIAL